MANANVTQVPKAGDTVWVVTGHRDEHGNYEELVREVTFVGFGTHAPGSSRYIETSVIYAKDGRLSEARLGDLRLLPPQGVRAA